ncbi:MAG: hypothetical protein ABI809_03780 [Caldimonas sp.]
METPTRRIITSLREFQDEVRGAIAQAAAVGAAEILLSDKDFADWPLGERAVIEDLTRWAHSRRRLTLVAHDFGVIARRHARWGEWRRQWSHLVDCRTDHELDRAQVPTICLVPGVVCIRVVDPVEERGLVSYEPVDAVACREAIDAVLQRSTEAFPATTLGL